MEFEVDIISRETTRPSHRTPDHLKTFRLSVFDQFSPAVYTGLVFFYTGNGPNAGFDPTVSRKLKASLSRTLTRFYPFAGRIRDNICVDCNDDGALFLEARVSCGVSLRDVDLARIEPGVLARFFPVDMLSWEAYAGSLLQVQVTFFDTGGLAIGILASHKLADAASFSMLVNSWAHSTREDGCSSGTVPHLTAASVFPPSEALTTAHPYKASEQKLRTRRYVFDADKISALRVESASQVIPSPTRVEAVCALVWNCQMRAFDSNAKHLRSSVMAQTVNLRKRIEPALPVNSIGNIIGYYTVTVDPLSDEAELPDLVSKTRKSMEGYVQNYAKKLRGPDSFSMIMKAAMEGHDLVKEDGFNLSVFTSWCRLDLYEVDFGWGKPNWMGNDSSDFKNTCLLLDTMDGEGIEVWVTMQEKDMERFEQDQELLSYASLNPSILGL